MVCKNCGAEFDSKFCPACGTAMETQTENPVVSDATTTTNNEPAERKGRWPSAILCAVGFLGIAGLHRFYTGKIGTGLLWLFTAGCLGIGTLVDLITILTGSYTDSHGNKLV